MSRYLELLKREKGADGELTKPGFVSSVSLPDSHIQEITAHDDLHAFPTHQAEVVAILRQDPALHYAFTTRNQGESMIITLAIRDVAVADLSIPPERYDGFGFMGLLLEVTA